MHHERHTLKYILSKLCLALFFTGAALLILWACRQSPAAFAAGKLRPLAGHILGVLSSFFAFLPFSAAEVLIYVLVMTVLIGIVGLVYRMITEEGKLRRLFSWAATVALFASVLFLVFEALFGGLYAAEPRIESLGLTVRKRPVSELEALCSALGEEANALSSELTYTVTPPDEDWFVETADDIASIVSSYTGVEQAPPKYVLASKSMSYTNITGFFSPFTGEANVNKNDLTVALPFTMAHELMHRWGVTAEDEANAYAFMILYECRDPFYRYSSVYMGLLYTLPKLRNADREAYDRVTSSLSDRVRADINAYYEHWKQYEGKTAEISDSINNAYLVINGEDDGIKSYGKVVDWMLAYREKKAG